MALSLNELNKKSTAKRPLTKKSKVTAKKAASDTSAKLKTAKSTRKAKIKPWQKLQSKSAPTREVLEQVIVEIQKQARTLKKDFKKADYWVKIALETQKWIKDIQVYPKIRIPVPPFLSHIDRD